MSNSELNIDYYLETLFFVITTLSTVGFYQAFVMDDIIFELIICAIIVLIDIWHLYLDTWDYNV